MRRNIREGILILISNILVKQNEKLSWELLNIVALSTMKSWTNLLGFILTSQVIDCQIFLFQFWKNVTNSVLNILENVKNIGFKDFKLNLRGSTKLANCYMKKNLFLFMWLEQKSAPPCILSYWYLSLICNLLW